MIMRTSACTSPLRSARSTASFISIMMKNQASGRGGMIHEKESAFHLRAQQCAQPDGSGAAEQEMRQVFRSGQRRTRTGNVESACGRIPARDRHRYFEKQNEGGLRRIQVGRLVRLRSYSVRRI